MNQTISYYDEHAEEFCKTTKDVDMSLCMAFKDMDFREEFHGIWACASLLHISKENIDDVLKRLWLALKDEGILYASSSTEKESGLPMADFLMIIRKTP